MSQKPATSFDRHFAFTQSEENPQNPIFSAANTPEDTPQKNTPPEPPQEKELPTTPPTPAEPKDTAPITPPPTPEPTNDNQDKAKSPQAQPLLEEREEPEELGTGVIPTKIPDHSTPPLTNTAPNTTPSVPEFSIEKRDDSSPVDSLLTHHQPTQEPTKNIAIAADQPASPQPPAHDISDENQPSENDAPSPAEEKPTDTNTPKEKKSKRSIIILILILIPLLSAVAIAAYISLSSSNTEPITAAPSTIAPTVTPLPDANWQTYSADILGVTLSYPMSHSINDLSTPDELEIVINQDQPDAMTIWTEPSESSKADMYLDREPTSIIIGGNSINWNVYYFPNGVASVGEYPIYALRALVEDKVVTISTTYQNQLDEVQTQIFDSLEFEIEESEASDTPETTDSATASPSAEADL